MDRKLLQSTLLPFHPTFIVDKDGNGTHTTITDAVRAAPHNSTERIIIYIKSGRYDENVKVGLTKTNIMFIGDGKGKTIIDGTRSVYDNFTTFHTATFAVTGNGFIARDITFENSADPNNHQAVALRVGSDHAVFYHCNMIGYQDTLYVHSQRQFFRECDIYGTVDFIFGNAAVVFQNCNIWARKPLDQQKITITAQSRKDPNQNSGISIHKCQVIPTLDLQSVASSYPTFLGRPWRLYSRTVYMESYLGGHIDQRGWLEWNDDFALDSLYYGEYKNYGSGAKLENRVTWKGYRALQEKEALGFTVGQFIDGSTWLPATNISFMDSLSSIV